VAVRTSYLVGEQADCVISGAPVDWLGPASEDLPSYVAELRAVRRTRWGVPSSEFWYVSGEYYLGTLVIRQRLTPELAEAGGHVGYHVVVPWRRQGHATRMLAAGLVGCRRLGLSEVLLTCDPGNEPSRRVIPPTAGCRAAGRGARTGSGSASPDHPASRPARGQLRPIPPPPPRRPIRQRGP